jgi:zinc protease
MASRKSDPLRLERAELDSGLELVRQAPPAGAGSFSATYVGPAGWGFDPSRQGGVARLSAHLVTSAAGKFDRVALARLLDRAGATLSSQCAPESAEATVWGPADEEPVLLGVLADAVVRPRFAADDVARAVRQLGERQLREAAQPGSRADRELLHAIFPPGHPYRETGVGDARSLQHIDRDAIVRFHRSHFTADGGLVVVTTRTPLPRLERTIARLFADLGGGRKAPALSVPAPKAPTQAVHRVSLPGRTQVEVRIGGPSIRRADPSYPAAFLANELLGGRPLLGRLFQTVREKEGLAYHASSDLEAMRYGGYFVAQAGTGEKRWRKVVRLLEHELGRLRDETVPARTLTAIRESAIGELPLSLESTSDAHELAVDAAYHHLPDDHWTTWPQRLRAVRPHDVREAAATAFGALGEASVVAGPIGRR